MLKPHRPSRPQPVKRWKIEVVPKVPTLLQYVSTGIFYGRMKVDGKIYRESPAVSCFRACFSEVADVRWLQRWSASKGGVQMMLAIGSE